MGIRAIVATSEHGETEAALRHVRRHFIAVDNLRAGATKLVNATFAVRDTAWWGQGTACASDSKKFGSWSSNFMTEYHARYGGNGVMIYWHVERKNVCIYSQLKSCSSSEVAANRRPPRSPRAEEDGAVLRGRARRRPSPVLYLPGSTERSGVESLLLLSSAVKCLYRSTG